MLSPSGTIWAGGKRESWKGLPSPARAGATGGAYQRSRLVGPLAQGLAVEIDGTVFGHDPVHVATGRHHARGGLQHRDDPRLARARHRGEGDDGLAPLGERRAADEVHLAADARVLPVPDGVGADLAGEVHLEGAVDGADLGVELDDGRIVDVAEVEHRHGGVVVEEVVEPARAQGEPGDDLAVVQLLHLAGDDPLLDEVDHPVREHLGVEQVRHPEGAGSSIKGREDHPVVHVTYEDVEAYAKWIGKTIPTEGEWEFAAWGGRENAEFAWGDELHPKGKMMANTWQGEFPWENLKTDGYERTSPIGSFPANGYGLYDMIGNVWEWTTDWYSEVHAADAAKAIGRDDPGGGSRCS